MGWYTVEATDAQRIRALERWQGIKHETPFRIRAWIEEARLLGEEEQVLRLIERNAHLREEREIAAGRRDA